MKKILIFSTLIIFAIIIAFTSCKKEDKDDVLSPIVEACLDPTNPLIADIISEKGDTVYFFGEKDEEGYYQHLTNIIIKPIDEDTATEIFFDELNRPTEIHVSNGVVMQFIWVDNQTAALTLVSPEGEQLNTVVDFSPMYDFYGKENLNTVSVESQTLSSSSPRTTTEQTTLIVKPIESHTSIENLPTKAGKTGNLFIEHCGVRDNAQCWVNVYDDSKYPYGKFLCRLPCTQINTGHYQFTLPDGIVENHRLEDYCDKIADAISFVCTPYSVIGPVGTEYLCRAITGALTLTPAIGAAPYFYGVCSSLNKALAVICNTLSYDGGQTGGGPTLIEALCDLIRIKHIEWNSPIYLKPQVNAIPYPISGGMLKYDGTGSLEDLYVKWGGDPIINSFTLDPPAPVANVGYEAIATFSCLPAGTRITMSIEGSDGYSDSQSEYVWGDLHYEAILSVPGAHSPGIRDVCTVKVETPDGSELSRTASLVFQ